VLAFLGRGAVTDTLVGDSAVEPVERPLREGLVCDAPPDADEVLGAIPVWPRWIGLTLALATSAALWAAIIFAARWALHA
jgi:hypothetical protein